MRLDGEQHKRARRSPERHFRLTSSPSPVRVLLARQRGGAMRIDFEISGGGTVYLLHPLTRAAHSWIAEHLPADARRLGDAVAGARPYIRDVGGGAIADSRRVR